MTARILFVDDDPVLLEAMERQFGEHHGVETAGGGRAALDVFQRQRPFDVVVADQSMPGMTGVELLTTIRSLSPDTARILLTGDPDLQAVHDAVTDGVIFRVLAKPCTVDALQGVINAGIRRYRDVRPVPAKPALPPGSACR